MGSAAEIVAMPVAPPRRSWKTLRAGARTVAGVTLLLSPAVALAQTSPSLSTQETPARDATEQLREAVDTQRQAEQQELFGTTRTVTFEEVLANPDDIEINLAWARQQIARGDVKGAAATFERILLIQPDLPRVRLLYAITLYRLDNIDEAERELRAVRLLDMAASLRAEIDRYLKQIELRRKRTRYSLTVSIGGQSDWNRNAAPSGGEVLVSDFRVPLASDDDRAADTAVNALGLFEVTYDLGYQARHSLFGAVTAFSGNQRERNELDLRVTSGEFGGTYDGAMAALTPSAYVRRVKLSDERYANIEGISLRAAGQYDADTELFVLSEAEWQEYFAIEDSRSAPERTGPQFVGGGGASHVLNQAMRWSIETDLTAKRASRDYNAYNGASLILSHTWLLGGGAFLITMLTGEYNRYLAPDPAVSARTRHDAIGKAQATLGVPVAALAGGDAPPAFLQDMTLTLSGELLRQNSNLPNYTYSNRRFSINVVKRWEF
jgi:tetratricopeptide (TPR) repeat protein